MSGGRYGYLDAPARSQSDHGPFEMTRRDPGFGKRDAALHDAMRDAYNYLHRDRGTRSAVGRDVGSAVSDAFGKTSTVAGALAGAGIAGLAAGLLGNANIGSTGIPNAIIPAAAFGLAAWSGKLPFLSKETWQAAALGSLGMGVGLWLLSQGLRAQTARTQQAPAVVVAGQPSSHFVQQPAAVAGAPRQYLSPPAYPQVGRASLSPLSEAEMISIASRY